MLNVIKVALLFLPLFLMACVDDSDLPPVVAATPFIPAVTRHGDLSVSDGKLRDSNGAAVQLCGMSTHGIQYFDDFYTENAIKALGAEEGWRADIIRISSYVNEGYGHGIYLDDIEYWRNRIDQLVSYATENNMYAMIDWHMLSPGDPNNYLAEAKEFWDYMSKKHGNNDNVLFDICNEPNNEGLVSWKENDNGVWVTDKTIVEGKSVDWGMIKNYANEIIPIIRGNGSGNVIIVGTPDWASSPQKVIGNELDFENIMYSMHFYADSHGSSYRVNVQTAIDAGLPIFVTEFGTQNSAGEGPNNEDESDKWLDFLDDNEISWCNWNYSDDWRSGAVFKKSVSFSSVSPVEAYYNRANLKESGEYIMDRLWSRF
jgi:endoglucanase